jgi:hypothetical protein
MPPSGVNTWHHLTTVRVCLCVPTEWASVIALLHLTVTTTLLSPLEERFA